MDHVSSMEERIVTERIRRKLEEVNAAAEKHLAGVQDHVNFTMQQAYFKCAYDCFDRRRSQEGINNCVENCSVPVLSANNVVETEMAKFQLDNGPGQSQFGWLTPTSASLGSSCQLSSTRWSTMSTSSSDSNTFNRLFLELYTAWLFFKREEYWWSGLSMMVVLTMWVNMLPLYGFFLRKKPPLGHILERLNGSLMVCQDKFEAAKLQKMKTDAAEDLESCVNRSIDDSIRVLPHVIEQIKSSLSIN